MQEITMKAAVWSGMILALAVLAAPAVRGGDAWYVEYEEGRAAAVAQGKDMLIDFGGSDWCLPCRWLKERVFSKPEFIERAGRAFVLVDIDRLLREDAKIPADRKDRYEKLQERMGSPRFRRCC
jgi:thiol:disulfide interchange protein